MIFGFKKRQENEPEAPKQSLFTRLKQGLKKTGDQLTQGLADVLLGKKQIDADLLEDLEARLLMADVGVEATQSIISDLTARLKRNELQDGESVYTALSQDLTRLLGREVAPFNVTAHKPTLILMAGINGAGKTTTVGKLAKYFQAQGKSVLLAAGDTFRAAAVEQLQVWGERNGVNVIAQSHGADSAAVVFDAFSSAQARGIDIVIADTAGRLHTQKHLMDELTKIARVVKKLDPSAPHETLLVLDASVGQNALMQTAQFKEAVGVTGLILTKLDGTAKGGVVFALAKQHDLPIRFVGVGERIDDLKPFEADIFVQALLAHETEPSV
jgi:fused signal recognition particle receptor